VRVVDNYRSIAFVTIPFRMPPPVEMLNRNMYGAIGIIPEYPGEKGIAHNPSLPTVNWF
jgi:hypothetical protein